MHILLPFINYAKGRFLNLSIFVYLCTFVGTHVWKPEVNLVKLLSTLCFETGPLTGLELAHRSWMPRDPLVFTYPARGLTRLCHQAHLSHVGSRNQAQVFTLAQLQTAVAQEKMLYQFLSQLEKAWSRLEVMFTMVLPGCCMAL